MKMAQAQVIAFPPSSATPQDQLIAVAISKPARLSAASLAPFTPLRADRVSRADGYCLQGPSVLTLRRSGTMLVVCCCSFFSKH